MGSARHARLLHPEHDAVRRAPRGLRGRRGLRHQLRVRLRLPARQHGRVARRPRPARARLRDRGRGRLDPDRRGEDAADHLRRARGRRAGLLRLRPHRARARWPPGQAGRPEQARRRRRGRRLRVRREAQDRLTDGRRDRAGRARAQDRQPVRPAQRPARQPPEPGAEGAVALPARRRLRRPGRRGQDRGRVHRPDHGRPALVGGLAPGRRGEGGREHPGGARHARDDHAAELLPPLRHAGRDDRHREDRGEGVRRDLRPPRRRDPHQRRTSPATTRTT